MSKKNNNKLREIGTVSHISSTNKVIVRTQFIPSIGSQVVNKNSKTIGRIIDVLGSTKKPYLSIKTKKKYPKVKKGDIIYLPPKNKRRRMKPRQAY